MSVDLELIETSRSLRLGYLVLDLNVWELKRFFKILYLHRRHQTPFPLDLPPCNPAWPESEALRVVKLLIPSLQS